jgi:hypothetical protein
LTFRVDPKPLEDELLRVAQLGFATAPEQTMLGINAVAAPIFDDQDSCAGALALVGSIQLAFIEQRKLIGLPKPAASVMNNGCTFSPPVIRGFDGSKRSRSSRFLTSARATTKASFRLLACRSATLKKALPK